MTEIAIVGMAGSFRGAADVGELWALVRDLGKPQGHQSGAKRTSSESTVLRDDGTLEPRHRRLLECLWSTLESSGYAPGLSPGSSGVFVACGPGGHGLHSLPRKTELLGRVVSSLLGAYPEVKPSEFISIVGEQLRLPDIVNLECATSLTAIHSAVASLEAHECDLALAGGIAVDESAMDDSSAIGMIAMRRLSDAVADGDVVLAVIKYSTVVDNSVSGEPVDLARSKPGPSKKAGSANHELAVTGASPGQVGLVLLDGMPAASDLAITVAALGDTYCARDGQHRTRLASVRTTVGNCGSAGGVTSLIAAVQALRHHWLPPSGGFTVRDELGGLAGTPFELAGAGRQWQTGSEPRRSAVSGSGAAGTEVHIVLEEAPVRGGLEPLRATGTALLLASAATPIAADATSARLIEHLSERPGLDRHDAAHTLVSGRHQFVHRRALVADTASTAIVGQAFQPSPRVVFCFPGAGSQYAGMAAGLFAADERFNTFRAAFEDVAEALADHGGPDVRRYIDPTADPQAMRRMTISSSTVVAIEVALARQLLDWGITPAAMVGHSIGEVVCAHLAGVLDLDETASMVLRRSELLERVGGQDGAMVAVPLAERELVPLLGEELSLAGVNAHDDCTVSGPQRAIADLEHRLAAMDVPVHRIGLAAAAHSKLLDPVLEEFASVTVDIPPRAPSIPYASNVTGQWVSAADVSDPRWWVRHLRGTVRFADGLTTALADGAAVVLEVGPGHALSRYARRSTPAPVASVPLQRHRADSTPDVVHLLGALGRLWTVGLSADWDRIVSCGRRRVLLPAYPFSDTPQGDSSPVGPQMHHPVALSGARPLEQWASVPAWEKLSDKPAPPSGSWAVSGDHNDPLVSAIAGELMSRGAAVTEHLGQATSAVVVVSSTVDQVDLRQFDKVLRSARAVAASDTPGARFAVLTRGVWAGSSPGAALALGPALVLSSEHPDAIGLAIDLDSSEPVSAADISETVETLLVGSGGLVTVRGGVARRATLLPFRLEPAGQPPVRFGGTWLVTGGLGAVGCALAKHLATVHGCSIVATVTEPLPADPEATRRRLGAHHPTTRRLDRLTDLRASGVPVRVECSDLTSPNAVSDLLDRLAGDGIELDGVVHAAGALADRPLSLLKQDDIARAVQAKAGAALSLVAELTARGVPTLVLMSSTSTHLHRAGQSAYVGANLVLDALAGDSGTLRVVTIDWGAWEGEGLGAVTAERILNAADVRKITRWTSVEHPVLHEVGISPTGSIVGSGALTTKGWLLAEHRLIDGTAMLPATALMDLPLAVLAATGEPDARISEVVLIAPVLLRDKETVAVRVVVDANIEGQRRCVRVEARHPGTGWCVHLQCAVDNSPTNPSHSSTSALAPMVLPDPLKGQREHIHFGPHWEGLERASRNDSEAVAMATVRESDEGWRLPPATTDLGIALGLSLLEGDGLWVPVSVDSVAGFTNLRSNQVQLHAHRKALVNRDTAIFDVSIDGTLCMRGLTVRRLASPDELSVTGPPSLLPDLGPALELSQSGGIGPELGGEAFDRVLASGENRLVVSSIDLDALHARRSPHPPATSSDGSITLSVVIEAWEEMLGTPVRPDDDFFLIGGDSVCAVRVVNRLRRQLGVHLGIDALIRARTPAALAKAIDQSSHFNSSRPQSLVPINTKGSRRPFFVVHGAGGNVLNLWTLGHHLPDDRPLYGLQARGSDGREDPDKTIEDMAYRYIDAIRSVQPRGPYLLGGYSGGGIIALEMSEILRAAEDHVDLVVLFDTYKPRLQTPSFSGKVITMVRNTSALGLKVGLAWLKRWLKRRITIALHRTDEDLAGVNLAWAHRAAISRYKLRRYSSDVALLQASDRSLAAALDYDWADHVSGRIEIRTVPGDHLGLFSQTHGPALAAEVSDLLEKAEQEHP